MANIVNSLSDGPSSWGGLTNVYNFATSNVGSYPITSQAGANTTPVAQALTGLIDVPGGASPSSYGNAAGVSGYARTANAGYAAVGFFGGGLLNVSNGSAWGANFFVANTAQFGNASGTNQNGAGFNNSNLYGLELNVGVFKVGAAAPGGNLRGLYIVGASEVLTSGSNIAVWVDSPGYLQSPRLKWGSAFFTADGAAINAIDVGVSGLGNLVGSQAIQLRGRAATGATTIATISSDANGAMYLSAMGGQNIVLGGALSLPPQGEPASPPSGWAIYTDAGDANKLKAKASNGAIVILGMQ